MVPGSSPDCGYSPFLSRSFELELANFMHPNCYIVSSASPYTEILMCVCACVHACMRACVHACVNAYVLIHPTILSVRGKQDMCSCAL